MNSKPNSQNFEPEMEAEVLLAIALELHRLADEATERARAAFERISRPMPLFPDDDGGR